MITKTQSYSTADGQIFATLEEAQVHELKVVLDSLGTKADTDLTSHLAAVLITNKEKVLDILTTGPRSRPKARKVNGAKRTRTPKAEVAT